MVDGDSERVYDGVCGCVVCEWGRVLLGAWCVTFPLPFKK